VVRVHFSESNFSSEGALPHVPATRQCDIVAKPAVRFLQKVWDDNNHEKTQPHFCGFTDCGNVSFSKFLAKKFLFFYKIILKNYGFVV
jgi:hypothetical protein